MMFVINVKVINKICQTSVCVCVVVLIEHDNEREREGTSTSMPIDRKKRTRGLEVVSLSLSLLPRAQDVGYDITKVVTVLCSMSSFHVARSLARSLACLLALPPFPDSFNDTESFYRHLNIMVISPKP